ncbi:piggyBac transposable element-derived protein 3 [Nephila pilipes]|uniref:PiggyBac transposable element-derived protein 3 n=1 Tax=Nephila pilipes TaxID=299642 RepID=A0A8X6IQ78_NEPPI|nr:piggyBac transposable element-derived protein 3 [Nephila pilipes]
MGVLQMPQVRMYWSKTCNVPTITENMNNNRFFEQRNTLHFVDKNNITESQKRDKLFLVCPILEVFRNACLTLLRTECLSIDEQIMPFSGRCPMRQYLPSKPNPVGLKYFVLAAPDGLVLDFLVYTGTDTVPVEDKQLYGLEGAVVKRLVGTIPTAKVTHLFTDRYFTGLAILDYLVSIFNWHCNDQPYRWCRRKLSQRYRYGERFISFLKTQEWKNFELVIAESLIKAEVSEEAVQERPQRRKNQQIVPLPVTGVRYDRTGHFPEHVKRENQMKCRFPGCPRNPE